MFTAKVMKYEEFSEKLAEMKADFAALHGREPETLAEFEEFLSRKKTGKTRTLRLRSLKGMDL